MMLLKGLILTFFVILIINVASSQQQQPHQQRHHRVQSNQRRNQVQDVPRARRIFAMCPPNFSKIGNECYYISTGKASWLDAHFDCKDKNSKLAEPLKYADRRLRKYLTGQQRHSGGNIWIGGMYNWQRMKWQWGYNGKDMTYQSFSQMKPGSSNDLKFHCSVLNPDLQYRWSAKLCMEKNNFICQHKMPYVGERNRQRIYAKWNETFPNQFANEIEVYITTNGNSNNKKEFYKLATKRPRVNTPKGKNVANRLSTQLEQHPHTIGSNGINNEINPPEVLTHRDSVDPQQTKPRNKKQGSKKLNLSGNVDLGTNSLKENRRKKVPKKFRATARMTTTSTTTERSNDLPIYPHINHHRHHHNEHRQEYNTPETPPPREMTTTTTTPRTTTSTTTERATTTSTTTPRTTTSTTPRTTTTTPRPTTTTPEPYEPEPEPETTRRPRPPTTTPRPYYEPTTQTTTTTAPADNEQETTTLSVQAIKAARIQKLRERLANLSPEDQKEYIRMKLMRSQAKKQNETNP